MADTFNGAGEDFGDLEDDGDDYNVGLDGSPMPEGQEKPEDPDGGQDDSENTDVDNGDLFDNPVPKDSDAYDPNAILQTAEADGDYTNDEFEPSRQPGMPARASSVSQHPTEDPVQAQPQVQDEQIDFTNSDQDPYTEQSYQNQQPSQQTQQQVPPQQWLQNDGYSQPPTMQGQQYPQQPAPPQWMQQQYPQYQQYSQQGGYQQMGGFMQDDGQYQQMANPAPAPASEPAPAPAPAPAPVSAAYPAQSGIGEGRQDSPQTQQPQEDQGEEYDTSVTDDGQYDAPQEQGFEEEDEPASNASAEDDAIPSVMTEIPDSEMIAKIISLADNIRNDLGNDERSALRKVLDVKEPDYGENNDQGKEDIMDSANMVFNSLRVRKSILDAFDDLLSAQDDNDSERAFFLIKQNDQDLRHIIEICRKFVSNAQKTDSAHLHISLAEIAAHCIAELSDDDVRLLKAVRKTLELSREIIHG